jgi:hypothetical protein
MNNQPYEIKIDKDKDSNELVATVAYKTKIGTTVYKRFWVYIQDVNGKKVPRLGTEIKHL